MQYRSDMPPSDDIPTINGLQIWAEQHERRDDDRFKSLGDSMDALTESIRNGTIILICGMTGIIGFFVARDMLGRPATAAAITTATTTTPSTSAIGALSYRMPEHSGRH